MAASIHSHKKDTREQKHATSRDAVPRPAVRTIQPGQFANGASVWSLPAALMAVAGVGLLILQPDAIGMNLLGRIWPVALVALAAWMTVQARRSLRSLGRPVVLYPPSRTA